MHIYLQYFQRKTTQPVQRCHCKQGYMSFLIVFFFVKYFSYSTLLGLEITCESNLLNCSSVPAGEHDFKFTRNLTRNLTRNFSFLERHFYLLLLCEVITRNNFQGKTVLNQESSKLKSLKTNKKLHITQKFTKNELSVVL